MIQKIISFSVQNKFIVGLFIVLLIAAGLYSMQKLAVDAVPDITNNQVQVVTNSPTLAPQEVEQFITFPVEMSMANIPDVTEIRSISRFGLSVVTIVFGDNVPIMKARQFVKEQLDIAQSEIPSHLGIPEMMPITTGLGEIYQYTLEVDSAHQGQYDAYELRTIQDWIVKRQLMGTEGIIEVSSFGGYLKQYEVAINPIKLQSYQLTLADVYMALNSNNENSGGSYIEKGGGTYYIRTEGLIASKSDIANIPIKVNGDVQVFIRDVADVKFGSPQRFGAMTKDGKGEAVGGIALMLKGANSSEAIENVHKRVEKVQEALPEGVSIVPYLDRSVLVDKAINTVGKNLIEGGLIVVFVLVLLLGNFRAGLIVASVIPLSLLFAFIMMHIFGVSANLMSLGAIDFGIVIDGAVIVVEGVLHFLYTKHLGKQLSNSEMDEVVTETSSSIIGSAAFGVLIIIVVFIPIMTLTGIEGKTFMPMAQTVSFAIVGALLLSITYVPMISSVFLNKNIKDRVTFADKLIIGIQKGYEPLLRFVMKSPKVVISAAFLLFMFSIFLFTRLGAEFVPTLNEGDLAMQVTIEPGGSLSKMKYTTTNAERILLERFPEIDHVVSKIGTAEVPTDPMAIEDADVMIILKDKSEWAHSYTREELTDSIKEALKVIEWAQFDITQPIQLRFNELISGAKTDIAIKIFGEDMSELRRVGLKIEKMVTGIEGAGDVKLEQTEGLPQLMVRYNREKLATHGINIVDVNNVIKTAYAGETAGLVYEGERRFDLVVRLDSVYRSSIDLGRLFIDAPNGSHIPLSELAQISIEDGPMQVSRENAQRRISVGVNVRNRDIAGFIEEVQASIKSNIQLKPGYLVHYGGQFENLVKAKERLSVAVPIALGLIFILLFLAFKSVKYALIIYATVPLSAIGGVFALLVRGMPFSISAGVGFIALFGVAVLNGIVLISYYNQLKENHMKSLKDLIFKGSLVRLRPVLMTAAVASLGFLPMAISTSEGAEVQKPLATVVIGGLISSTILTLFILPLIYYLTEKKRFNVGTKALVMLLFFLPFIGRSQVLTLEMALDSAYANNPNLKVLQNNIKSSELDQKAVWGLGNSSVSYQYGQMNSDAKDYYWQIDQELGNPMLKIKQSKEANAATDYHTMLLNQSSRDLRLQVQTSWLNRVVTEQKKAIIQEQILMFDSLLVKQELQYQNGEISATALSLSKATRLELLSFDNQLNEELIKASLNLKSLTYIKHDYAVPTFDFTAVDSVLISEFEGYSIDPLLMVEQARQELMSRGVQTARSAYFPTLSLGYFNQSLDYQRGFQGLIVGVSIPLFDRSTSTAVKQAELAKENAMYELQATTNQLENQLQSCISRVELYTGLYLQQRDSWQKDQELLSKSLDTEVSSGNINYYEYTLMQTKIMNYQINQLSLYQSIIQAQFDLNYYINQN